MQREILTKMKDEEFKIYLKQEEARAFSGWDFSYFEGKIIDDEIPWDYKELVCEKIKKDSNLLDMGTGGGEFLKTLNHNPFLTTVTEGYPPNIAICERELKPLGIKVIPLSGKEILPVSDNSFDLVCNRHEDYNIQELRRIIKEGGYFITQQVGSKNNYDLAKYFNPQYESLSPNNDLQYLTNELRKNGFVIEKQNEVFLKSYYNDIGALVYYAKIIEWEFIDFSVEKHFEKIKALNEQIKAQKEVTSILHRFMVVAKKVK